MTGTRRPVDAPAFYHAALTLALGMVAQVVAERSRLPSIVILLAAGAAAGPDGLRLLDPGALGSARRDLVTVAVTIILFEGGLALRLEELRRQQRSLALLLTLGGAISMIAGTAAAHYLLDIPWAAASLYGSLVIVTGPTVVTPLLTRLTLDRAVRELLIGEAVLIDPIGAIAAIVTAEYVLGHSQVWEAGWLLLARLGVGAALGALVGVALGAAMRRRWIPEGLRNPAVLGTVLLTAAMASRVSSEAGLMAAVAQGIVLANAGVRELGRLRQFKEELTVVFLSFIFVLLAADLPLRHVRALGWESLLVVGILIWVARPLAVFTCTTRSGLTLSQRLFVSWVCPRGIIAASMAGLFAISLAGAGVSGSERIEALVFVTVAFTVALQGLTAAPVARLLGVDLPELRGTLIVGADAFGRFLARLLAARGRQAVLLDLNREHCRAAQAEGLSAYNGDALSVEDLEDAGVQYADTVVAMTRNPELNILIAQRVRENFRVERVLAGDGTARTENAPFPGNFPGPDEVNGQLQAGRAQWVEYEIIADACAGQPLAALGYGPGEFALLVCRRDRAYVATGEWTLAAGDRLFCLQVAEGEYPLAAATRVVSRANARDPLPSERRPVVSGHP